MITTDSCVTIIFIYNLLVFEVTLGKTNVSFSSSIIHFKQKTGKINLSVLPSSVFMKIIFKFQIPHDGITRACDIV